MSDSDDKPEINRLVEEVATHAVQVTEQIRANQEAAIAAATSSSDNTDSSDSTNES